MTKFKTIIGRTKTFIALFFLCWAFGLHVAAQTENDKPMSVKALTALISNLKEVVSKSAFDDKNSAAVARMWDQRTDLSDKPREEVINLLYDDVKSVIKNPGIRYEIYSIFSFYKSIPDELPSAETAKNNEKKAKTKLVGKSTDLTISSHPSIDAIKQTNILPKEGTAKTRKKKSCKR